MRAEASVDVVVPSYGYGRYLETCVASVLAQDVPDLRVLVVDNASPDDSLAVARRLAAADPRVTVLAREVNRGPHASFNAGVDWASATAFLVLCADDCLAPGALPRALAVMRERPDVVLTYGAAAALGPDDRPDFARPPDGAAAWAVEDGAALIAALCRYAGNFLPGPTVVVRTAAQKRAGRYRPSLTHADDLEMWLRIARLGRVACTEAVQAYARLHPRNQSAGVGAILPWYREFLAAYESFFATDAAQDADAARLAGVARRAVAWRACRSGTAAFGRLRPAEGLALMRFALRARLARGASTTPLAPLADAAPPR